MVIMILRIDEINEMNAAHRWHYLQAMFVCLCMHVYVSVWLYEFVYHESVGYQ